MLEYRKETGFYVELGTCMQISGVFYVQAVGEESRVVCGTEQPDKQSSSLPVLLICFDFKAAEGFFRCCGWVSLPQLCSSKFGVSFEREAPAE